jgi:hypothetical protein
MSASNLQAAHQLRLQQLLEAGRLTPAPSPTPSPAPVELEPPAGDASAAAASSKPARRGTKRPAHPKPNLPAVAESGQVLPDSMDYIVAVSTRSPDVGLENDHNLHCLCAFPTHQAAYDWIMRHRLSLARHYMQDPRLSEAELQAATQAAGMDELFLGENTSMEILQVPHFNSLASAPPPEGALFADHFASKRVEEEAERQQKQEEGKVNAQEGNDADAKADAEEGGAEGALSPSGKKKATGKNGAKRRKV